MTHSFETTPAELARINDFLAYKRHNKDRQKNRRTKLNEIARIHGFRSWSALETAAINGEAKITKIDKEDTR